MWNMRTVLYAQGSVSPEQRGRSDCDRHQQPLLERLHMLLITGTQRCGTSLTAEFIRACGYPITGDDDPVGKYEDPAITLAYRTLLADVTFPWSDYPIVSGNYPLLGQVDCEVAKFAYLMMDPKLMQIWLEHRGAQRDKFVILVREAERVVQSKRSTPERA